MQIVILAAGHGTRMKHELPKPLVPLSGKPIIAHLLESIEESGVCERPTIVVAPNNVELFKKTLGEEKYDYVIQEEQLGTGYAVLTAKDNLMDKPGHVMVLYGDHPLVSAETLKKIHSECNGNNALTLATAMIPDFEEWRAGFYNFGRIVRDEHGNVERIVEKKDSTDEELRIKEVNPAYFCFEPQWLWEHLDKLDNNNAQGEYYLTDLVQMAVTEGAKIKTVQIDPKEALGINTQEQLKLCEELGK